MIIMNAAKRVLEFGGKSFTPSVRKLSDMKDVIYDTEWMKSAPDMDLYYMYRDVHLSRQDHNIAMDNNLRYDITVIPPGRLGKELVKTAGHYHPPVSDTTDLTYPEVYEVLKGKAHYLLQKAENGKITDAIIVEAEAGDKVIIPPNYGHVTINPTENKELMMANWVSREFSSIYEPYKECRGAAYYELAGGILIKNEKCGPVPEIRHMKPTNISKVGFQKGKEMYGLVRDVQKLEWLNKPQDYGWLWEEILGGKSAAKASI